MSSEPRQYLRHILVEENYLISQGTGLNFEDFAADETLCRAEVRSLELDGILTLTAVLLSFLAFDDITIDNATHFTIEYAFLAVCALWCAALAVWLFHRRERILGALCLLLLAAALWGQQGISPGTVPAWRLDYLAVLAATLWFFLLSLFMIARGFACLRN